jgi:tetratricopeptide (TPR) repeat protein/TolB-like protein/DNA-binding winged helix-turn-helix (wHTH) protein
MQGFYLGDLLIEPLKGEVSDGEESRHMPPKAVELLMCLAERPGEVVERAELLAAVWGAGQGSEEALSHAISNLRQALGDHPDDPAYIQTLPRRGYRLLHHPVPVTEDPPIAAYAGSGGLADLGWIENLKRRGVIQASVAYTVFGWLLIQVADIVFEQLYMTGMGTFVTILVIAGFPVVVLLSWFLEFRDGRAVLHELSPAARKKRHFSRTYISVIGALAIAAIGVFLYDRNVGLPRAPEIPEFVAQLPPVEENSFAVLPFKNVDGSETTAILASGLVDDVITQLSQVPGLRVSSRGDSSILNPDTPSQRVRERLRVSKYLEGSVEAAGEEIRVIVQLIDSETGFQVFSRRFNRVSDDYLDLRDEITKHTVSTVRASLPGKSQASIVQTLEDPGLDAYLLYRRGVDASRLPLTIDVVNTAIGWFDAALEVDPEYAAAHAGKCAVLVDAYTEVGNPAMIDRATESCASALNFNPNLAVVHAALGRLYESTGRLTAAEQSFERAVETDPSNLDALGGLGDVYLRQNRKDEAEQVLRRNLGMHPGSEVAHTELGAFLFRTGRYAEAAEQYEYVVALNPDNMNGYSNLGTAQMLGGYFAEAIATFNKALEIEPRHVTYSNLGLMFYYLGDLDQAVENHERAVELAPNDYLARINHGDALWAAGREEEALAAYRRARELAERVLQVDSRDPFPRLDLAWIHAMLGNSEEARSRMDRALPLAPDDPYTHYIDGLIYLRAGDVAGAAGAFEKAVELGYSRQLLAADPQLGALATDTRFADIVGKR